MTTLKDIQNLIQRAGGGMFRIVVIRGHWCASIDHGPGVFIAQGHSIEEAVRELAEVVREHIPNDAAPN